MAKVKKESTPVTIRMDKEIFDSLEAFCEASGQSKTTAIERALTMYIADYAENQAILSDKKQK